MKKTIVKALAVMAVTVTAIALFGCNNVLGSAALREVIESEEGQNGPVSTAGMFVDFDENATFNGVSLSNYASGLHYDWPDSTEGGEDNWMEVGLSGTIKFYEDGYYIPFILSDDYQANWGIDKREGDVCLTKVSPIYWSGVWASVSKNGVEIRFNIKCDNVDFDTSGDNRPLVAAYGDGSYYLNSGSVDISRAVYDDEYVSISGDFKWISADEMNAMYGGSGYTFNDGYYLPVIFHDSFRWTTYASDDGKFYDLGLKVGGTQPVYLLYLGTDSSTTKYYGVEFGIGGENEHYQATISVSFPEDDSDVPETPENPENPDVPGKVINGIGVGGDEGFTFADLVIKHGWNGSEVSTNEDGTITLSCVEWLTYDVELPEIIDVSGKKIAVTAKAGDNYVNVENSFKIIFIESDEKQSEITGNAGNNLGWCSPFTDDFEEYIGTEIWKGYDGDESADLSKITKIRIAPQHVTGDVIIKSIMFVD